MGSPSCQTRFHRGKPGWGSFVANLELLSLVTSHRIQHSLVIGHWGLVISSDGHWGLVISSDGHFCPVIG